MAIITIALLAITLGKAKNEPQSEINIDRMYDYHIEKTLLENEVKGLQGHIEKVEVENNELKDKVSEYKTKLEKKEEEKRKYEEEMKNISRDSSNAIPRSSMKSYMGYRKITSKNSSQYKLQRQSGVYTDSEGFRKIGDKFIIAIGTYFKCDVGQDVIVHLDTGKSFKATIGDIKANKDTDSTNLQHKNDGSVVEFLVDERNLSKDIKKMGDCSYSKVNNFKGNIVSISKI